MSEKLNAYRKKRDFEKTLEPEGEASESQGFFRFVVQHHMARREHYDFRLEWNGVLLSWAIPKGPSYNTGDKRLAVQVEDHPLDYRNFEGIIPKGEYGGGTVMLWDEGTWEPYGNVDKGLINGSLKFELKGKRLKGKWALIRLKVKENETKVNWLLLKERDQYASSEDVISQFTTSIRTGRTMDEIEQGGDDKMTKNPFNNTPVELAKLVTGVPKDENWLYEIKYDGYRIVAYIEANNVRLVSRNDNDYTGKFQGIASALTDWAAGRAMILDGEMVITDEHGKTDFQALQNHLRNPNGKRPIYIIFDLLALDGADLRSFPLLERKEKLQTLMLDAPKSLYYSSHLVGNGKESFDAACAGNLEGIIGKKADSAYSGTRNGDWIKLKCAKRQKFVIGGFTLSAQKLSGFSSLLLGLYEGENFIYVGRVGTGFNQLQIKELASKFEDIIRHQPAFAVAPKPRANETITWLEPELVAEVQFTEWTNSNQLRHPSYKGLRPEISPRNLQTTEKSHDDETQQIQQTSSSVVIAGIQISNPDKILFDDPAITKADVARYYEQVSKRILPYISHRILSVVRCPKGSCETCFFKKHPAKDSKNIIPVSIANSSGDDKIYYYIEDIKGLISEVQMGTLEFHTWGSCVHELEKPDMMVFDLDPDEDMDIDTVRQGVKDLKSILDELSLNAYLKTSGGKGYHVVIPLKPSVSWDRFNNFAKQVAQVMEQKWPDRYTSNVRKQKRTNKIFIDWIRNGRGATSIAPYSLRARKGAKVSMPISWAELNTVAPDGIGLADAIMRTNHKDPWEEFFKNSQILK